MAGAHPLVLLVPRLHLDVVLVPLGVTREDVHPTGAGAMEHVELVLTVDDGHLCDGRAQGDLDKALASPRVVPEHALKHEPQRNARPFAWSSRHGSLLFVGQRTEESRGAVAQKARTKRAAISHVSRAYCPVLNKRAGSVIADFPNKHQRWNGALFGRLH